MNDNGQQTLAPLPEAAPPAQPLPNGPSDPKRNGKIAHLSKDKRDLISGSERSIYRKDSQKRVERGSVITNYRATEYLRRTLDNFDAIAACDPPMPTYNRLQISAQSIRFFKFFFHRDFKSNQGHMIKEV